MRIEPAFDHIRSISALNRERQQSIRLAVSFTVPHQLNAAFSLQPRSWGASICRYRGDELLPIGILFISLRAIVVPPAGVDNQTAKNDVGDRWAGELLYTGANTAEPKRSPIWK